MNGFYILGWGNVINCYSKWGVLMMRGSRKVYMEGGIDNFPNIFHFPQPLLNNIGGGFLSSKINLV